MSIELVMLSNHLILCRPLLLLRSNFPSIKVISNESALCIRWPKDRSFSFSISPSSDIQGWCSLGLTNLISLQSKGLSGVFSSTTVQKHQFFSAQPSLWPNSHICKWLLEKTIALTIWIFVGKMISLLFNRLSRFVIAFLPRSKCLLISWLQSTSAMILESKKIKWHYFHFSPSICHEVMVPDAMILVFLMLSFKTIFSLFSFTCIKRVLSYSSFFAIRVVSSAYLRLLIFLSAILIPACASSSPTFRVMYTAWKLNKWGDNIHYSFPTFEPVSCSM